MSALKVLETAAQEELSVVDGSTDEMPAFIMRFPI